MLLSGEGIELTSTVSLLFTAPDFQFLGVDSGTDFSVSVTGGVTLLTGSNGVTVTPASGIHVTSNAGPSCSTVPRSASLAREGWPSRPTRRRSPT